MRRTPRPRSSDISSSSSACVYGPSRTSSGKSTVAVSMNGLFRDSAKSVLLEYTRECKDDRRARQTATVLGRCLTLSAVVP